MPTKRKGLFDGLLKYLGLWHADEIDPAHAAAAASLAPAMALAHAGPQAAPIAVQEAIEAAHTITDGSAGVAVASERETASDVSDADVDAEPDTNLVVLDIGGTPSNSFNLADRLRSIDKLNRPARKGGKSSPRVAPAGKSIPKSARGVKIIYTPAVSPIRQRKSASLAPDRAARPSAIVITFPGSTDASAAAVAA
ncbi:MAG: hypothetical protein NW205_00350 [Hyphomicrobiaceae bacterium]|nr:hypothetical protein [Hyphomicrobiaceae bacterium]